MYVREKIRSQTARESKPLLPELAAKRLEKLRESRRPVTRTSRWSTKSVITEYANDPVGFCRDVLAVELWWRQVEIALALVEHDRVAVKSGQKIGKSLFAICMSVWWVCTRPRGRVIMTSSSYEQVVDPLWLEMRELYRRLDAAGVHIIPAPQLDPGTGCRWPDGRSIRGFSTDKPERAAGKSGDQQLFILDECSGIRSQIAEAFLGNTTGGGKVLCLSNPTEASGFFYECFTSRSKFWHGITVSSRETPNYVEGRDIIPGLAIRKTVDENIANYGEGSPFVQVRVDGEFPTQSADSVVGIGLVTEALRRGDTAKPEGEGTLLDLGVDVALFGDDDSAVTARRALLLYTPNFIEKTFGCKAIANGFDHIQVADLVVGVIKAMRKKGERVRVKIDAGGGYGTAVWTELRSRQRDSDLTKRLDPEIELVLVNVATAASDPDKYPQLRDELWFGLRDFFADGGIIAGGMRLRDEKFEGEAIAARYSVTRKNQLKVDDKARLKAELRRSPDRADAACLAVYECGVQVKDLTHKIPDLSRWGSGRGRGFG